MKAEQGLALFVATAEAGSLSAAARRLGQTPAAASAALKRLEAELGALLFVRSTRSLRLTSEVVRRWALTGHGVVYKSGLDVAQDLRAGSLIALCCEWQGEAAPLYLVCADRRQLSPAVKRLRQHLVERCAALAGRAEGPHPSLLFLRG
jgi:DNA-binding transcriptional LysR family regulator